MYKGLYDSLWQNTFKSILLIISFPMIFWISLVCIAWFVLTQEGYTFTTSDMVLLAADVLLFLGPIMIVWGIIAFLFHRQLIFSFSGAHPVTRKQEPMIYNIVENLCISQGLPVPKIGIIEDTSMNAFAVGRHPKHARIVFTRGLITRLNKSEIEAVAAHELTHIINRDSLMMIIIVVFVGIVATLGQILLRIRGDSRDRSFAIIPLVGLVFLILGYLVYPLIRLALSRRREFLADAGAVMLTKDKYAMISALQKISSDPQVESIQKDTIAAMCIENPMDVQYSGFFSKLLATHPPVEERIRALMSY